ncbi:hypothetical protein O165_007375 [Pseudomonas soli]|nr:hypothetical protein O165_007375 [Pseudomonas soli]
MFRDMAYMSLGKLDFSGIAAVVHANYNATIFKFKRLMRLNETIRYGVAGAAGVRVLVRGQMLFYVSGECRNVTVDLHDAAFDKFLSKIDEVVTFSVFPEATDEDTAGQVIR